MVVHDESRPRGLWRLGKVEGLISGADGQTIGAVVKVFSRKERSTTINRPVQRIYHLEIRSTAREGDYLMKPRMTKNRKCR